MLRKAVFCAISLMMVLLLAPVAYADIFDDPQNLKVLPKDISPFDLRSAMRSYVRATGLRCSSCHVGEEGQNLREYDFASDEKELKKTAREMVRMVAAINKDHLGKISDDPLTVDCMTCHRGVSTPRMTGDVLAEAGDEGGVEGLVTAYKELKDRYYGTHSYDFSEFTISEVARARATAGKPDEASAILDLMIEENPESFSAYFIYGELSRGAGDNEKAIGYFRKALEINPQADFVQRRLDQLESAQD